MGTSISIHSVKSASVEVCMFDNFTSNVFTIVDRRGATTELCLYTDGGKPFKFEDAVVVDKGWLRSENNPANYPEEVTE